MASIVGFIILLMIKPAVLCENKAPLILENRLLIE